MSFSAQQRTPRTPTPPQGETVAAYATYLEAQRAVDHLADSAFPVQLVTIVGTDLRMVERVTGRLSYPRVAMGGFVSGAWFGLFVGLLLSLFTSPGSRSPFLPAILIGGAFGLLFSVVPYSFTRGRRDFTSSSQIVASSYAVLCAPEKAHQARHLLQGVGGGTSGWPVPPTVPTQPPGSGPDLRPAPEDVAPRPAGAPGPEAAGGHETPTQPPAPPES